MQEQEIRALVASVLDALKTKQASPAPSAADDGMAPATPAGDGSAGGSGAAPELLAATGDADTDASLEDLGGPAGFLASAASDFVNGLILYVDGGILAYIGKQPQ